MIWSPSGGPSARGGDGPARSAGEDQADGGLTERELSDLLIFLFVAGYDTSKNHDDPDFWALIDRPEMYRRAAKTSTIAAKGGGRRLPLHSTTSNQRILDEDLVYRGIVLGRTRSYVPAQRRHARRALRRDADAFDPDRERANRHIGFGLGAHICLGQYIARAQIHEGLHQIARRLKNPRSSGPLGYRPFSGTWGLRGLPIEFDTAGDSSPA